MFEDLKWLCYVYSIQVAKWMRPMVRSNKNKNVFSIVFVIPSALDVIHLAKLDDPPTEKNVRDLVSKADGAKGEYKSAFQGHERKISCVKVPRHNFSNEILLQIDERMYFCFFARLHVFYCRRAIAKAGVCVWWLAPISVVLRCICFVARIVVLFLFSRHFFRLI